MIVRTLDEILQSTHVISGENWISRRLLLHEDSMGFSLHDTIIKAGTETHMWYRNHLEAVYCIEGEGEVEVLNENKKYSVEAGTVYALNEHDRHILRAKTTMRMVCVFNPPLRGHETHDQDGSYPPFEKTDCFS